MKKLLIISAMLLVGALSVNAQTYYYKYLYTVDKNGIRKKTWSDGYAVYYTFSNNRGIVYRSDKNGNVMRFDDSPYARMSALPVRPTYIYSYTGSENGIIKYKLQDVQVPGTGYNYGKMITLTGDGFINCSTDYSRINVSICSECDVEVYERASEPEKKDAPTQLY